MTPLVLLLACVLGGVGAGTRLLLDGLIRTVATHRFPVGTAVINLSGSLALGLLTGLTAAHLLPDALRIVLGSGFLGGYTTFSTASFETVRLLEERRVLAGLANGLGVLVGAVVAAGGGYLLGLAL